MLHKTSTNGVSLPLVWGGGQAYYANNNNGLGGTPPLTYHEVALMTDTQASSERGQREFVPVTSAVPNGCEGRLRAAWSRRPPLRHCDASRNASAVDRPRFWHCRA